MVKIAICTVNWNGKKDTLEFLSSLSKLDTKNLEVRVFLTDGGSTDGSISAIKKQFPTVQIIEKQKNRGSAGGYNDSTKAGLAWNANFILLINNDTIIKDKNLLRDLLKTIHTDPTIGVVSPKIYFAPGFEYQKNYKKADQGNVIWYAGGSFDWQNIRAVHRGIDEVDTGHYDKVEETGFASGACMLVRREIFDKGIFWDEAGLFAYYDDNDFEERVKRAKYKLYYDGLTSIYHKVSRTGGIGSPASDYFISRNKLIFTMRYAPLRTKLAVLKEAAKLLFTGRSMQKRGVRDYFLGIRGAPKDL